MNRTLPILILLIVFAALFFDEILSSDKVYHAGEIYRGPNTNPDSPHKRVYATITYSSFDGGYSPYAPYPFVHVTWAGGIPVNGEQQYSKKYFTNHFNELVRK